MNLVVNVVKLLGERAVENPRSVILTVEARPSEFRAQLENLLPRLLNGAFVAFLLVDLPLSLGVPLV